MSQYESALAGALFVVFPALVRLGADSEELRRELRERADLAQEWGSVTHAEVLRQIAQYPIPELGCDTNGKQLRD
jgi:hypothetical protein